MGDWAVGCQCGLQLKSRGAQPHLATSSELRPLVLGLCGYSQGEAGVRLSPSPQPLPVTW